MLEGEVGWVGSVWHRLSLSRLMRRLVAGLCDDSLRVCAATALSSGGDGFVVISIEEMVLFASVSSAKGACPLSRERVAFV